MADIAWAIAEAREFEDATHTDTCKITRKSDDPPTWDPEHGTTPAPPTVVYPSLSCRLRSPSASDRAATAGEHQFTEGDSILRLAAGTTGIRIGDTVEMLDSPQGVAMDDSYTVMWPISGSHMTATKLVVRKVAP